MITPIIEMIAPKINKNPEIRSWEIYRDDKVLVMINAYPYSTGHLMVVPLEHYEKYETISLELLLHINQMIQRSIILLEKSYSPKGFNIGLNQGNWGGASINHLHFHVVPRYGVEMAIVRRTVDKVT